MDEELKNAIVTSVKEGQEEVKSKISELETKLAKLEATPIQQKNVGIIVPEVYKGYRLDKQLEKYREGKFANQCDNIAKMIIDVAKGETLQKAAAVQVEGTDAKGGYLVLDAFDDMITATARENSVMMPLVNQKTVSMTDTFKFNKQLTNVSLAWDSEGSVTATSGTYSQTSVAIKRLSGYVSMSNELIADSAYDIVGDITEQFGYAMAQELDNQILNGTGTPCSGVLTAAAGYSVVLASGLVNWSSVAAGDFSLAIAALSTTDVANATFVLGKKGAHYVRSLKDTTNAPIFQAIAGPNLNTIYGNPLVIANKIDDSTGGTGGYYGVLGNFKEFYLINRLGALELLIDPYSDSVSYNTRFIWATRKGLSIKRSTAFCRLGTP